MNRRSFLRALGGVTAAIVAPIGIASRAFGITTQRVILRPKGIRWVDAKDGEQVVQNWTRVYEINAADFADMDPYEAWTRMVEAYWQGKMQESVLQTLKAVVN